MREIALLTVAAGHLREIALLTVAAWHLRRIALLTVAAWHLRRIALLIVAAGHLRRIALLIVAAWHLRRIALLTVAAWHLRRIALLIVAARHQLFSRLVARSSSRIVEPVGFGLVERAVVVAGVALKEGIRNILDRDVKPVDLAVYRELDIACQRGANACLAHNEVGEVVLHICRVGHNIVEVELVKPLIGLAFFIFSEVYFEAVAV